MYVSNVQDFPFLHYFEEVFIWVTVTSV